MKTKEEILKIHGLQQGFRSTYSWDDILSAMEIYASQFKQRWIPVSERLPEVDTEDKWNSKHKISKRVLCFSKSWGMRFGQYFHMADMWNVDGVSSSNGVEVDCYMNIEPPKTETK